MGLWCKGTAAVVPFSLPWPRRSLNLSKMQGVVLVSSREPMKVRKVLLALYWSGELLVTPLHQAPKHLIT